MKIISKILIVAIISLAANWKGCYLTAHPATVYNAVINKKAVKMNEIWKDIKGYEGLYQISNLGKVKSLERFVKRKNSYYKQSELIRKQSINNRGYYCIDLCKNAKYKHLVVHKLVAKAFIKNPENKKFINHKDGNKLNNNSKNLEWCTIAENNQHAYDIGLKVGASLGKLGKDNPSSKEIYMIDKNTNKILEHFYSVHDVFRKYGFAVTNVAACARGTAKTSFGYKWKYKINVL